MGKYLVDSVSMLLEDFYFKPFFNLNVKGIENVKGSHVLYAANHRDHIDSPLLGMLIYEQLIKNQGLGEAYKQQPYFIAKKTLFKWPFSCLLNGLKAVPYNRNFARNYRDFVELLKNHSVLVFPQGGRKRKGVGPLAGHLVLETGVNVLPIKIERPSKLEFEVVFGEEFRPEGNKRNEVSQNIMNRIYSLSWK